MKNIYQSLGFSLIELIIVMVIVGVLAVVAIPGYQSHLIKVRRTTAKSALMQLANKMEQYYIDHHSYQGATLRALQGQRSNQFYRLKIVEADDDGFILQAVPTGIQEKDQCGTLTLNQLGEKKMSGHGSCWS